MSPASKLRCRPRLALVGACAGLVASACSLMAPSDAELRGGEVSLGGSANSRATGGGSPGDGGEATAGDTDVATEGGAAGRPDPGDADVRPFPGGDAGAAGSAAAASAADSGQILWLRADAGVTVTAGAVSAWKDQSGRANHATQAMATHAPKRVTPVAGKLPWLEFDGVDDSLDLPSGFANFDAGLSLFAAVQETVLSSCPAIIQLSNAPDVDDIDLDFDSVRGSQQTKPDLTAPGTEASDIGRTFHYEVGAQFVTAPGDSFAPGSVVTFSVVHAPTGKVELRIGGVYLAGGKVALPKAVERLNNFIGRSLYTGCKAFHGRVGELMVYERAVSEGERLGIEQYLSKRWQ